LRKRYISKQKAREILNRLLNKIRVDYNYDSVEQILNESHFLSLQTKNKSQTALLEILSEIIENEYNYDISQCGQNGIKNFIYIDDIFATGGTFYNNMSKWWNSNPEHVKTLKAKKSRLIVFYFFIHERHYENTMKRFYYVDKSFENHLKIIYYVKIENFNQANKNISLAWPTIEKQPLRVEVLRRQVIKDVDNHYQQTYNEPYTKPDDFFRSKTFPDKEILFTSKENRKKIEDIFLNKGIEIINNTYKDTFFKPLGFTVASKNFGFGALTFTWRNIANNSPLPFWFTGGNFHPLFPKKSS